MSDELWQTLRGVWPPLLLAVPVLLLARRPWSGARTGSRGAWGAGLGIGLGFAAAYWALKGSPWPPGGANEWHVSLVVGAGLLGACTFLSIRLWTAFALLLLAASPVVMFSRLWNGWEGAEGFAQLGLSAAVLLVLGAHHGDRQRRCPARRRVESTARVSRAARPFRAASLRTSCPPVSRAERTSFGSRSVRGGLPGSIDRLQKPDCRGVGTSYA